MRISRTRWVGCFAALLIAAFVGCPRSDEPPAVEPSSVEPSGGLPAPQAGFTPTPSEEPAAVETVKEPEPPPPPTVPEVLMTDALRATCLVFIGDPMPTGELADLDGKPQALADLFGEKLTVILFWTSGESLYAQMAASGDLEDLEKDVAEPYADKGVAVVAVNVNNPADSAQAPIDEAGATFPNLSDPEGKFFAKIATENLPRVYLVDAEGKIIWFDLEFSRTTRRNLLQAIQVELGEI